MNRPGPIRLAPVFLPKVWAAPSLPPPFDELFAAPAMTGEIWLAGSVEKPSPVAQGPLAGMGLDEVMARFGDWITGGAGGGLFPLLLKLLNVGQWLSVQVHPNDALAAEMEGQPNGKTEAWHVLAAGQGAQIIHGLKPGVDRAALAQAVEDGRVAECLARVPARAGDTFFVDAGTVHTIGPGLLIFEIQQPSDLTYRFYDWDRPGPDGKLRDLHLEKGLRAMAISGPGSPAIPPPPEKAPDGARLLVDAPGLRLSLVETGAPYQPWGPGPVWRAFFILAGGARLSLPGYEPVLMHPGQTWLAPAGPGPWRLEPLGGPVRFLESSA